MSDYRRPIIEHICPHCAQNNTYYFEDINDYFEVMCKNCGKVFWDTAFIEFKKLLKAGKK